MLRVATGLVGAADAEDAAQEALMRAWQAWDTLREVDALGGWLMRITINVCRDWQRGRLSRHLQFGRSLPDEVSNSSRPRFALLTADPGASDHTGALDLRGAVNHLPAHLRLVVVLRYYAGMDATEVGNALGIPAVTVRTRLHRALRVLRDRLDDAEVRPPAVYTRGGM
jgi:RNA polymerase sigma-70 factor (ECF subfamily)